jgi:hypothetical protein
MESPPTWEAHEAASEPIDPWLSMWLQPRRTVRHLVDQRPDHGVLLLTALGGIAESLDSMSGRNAADSLPLPVVLLSRSSWARSAAWQACISARG